jgi:hypothetical protein
VKQFSFYPKVTFEDVPLPVKTNKCNDTHFCSLMVKLIFKYWYITQLNAFIQC